MITRRKFLTGLGALALAGVSLGGYAFGVEPLLRLNITRYRLNPPGWPKGPKLKLLVLADIHACEPWMKVARIEQIVAQANAEQPDIVLLLGDYVSSVLFTTANMAPRAWADALAGLEAPLGVHAVLGNHDWWEDRAAQARQKGPIFARRALEAAGIPVYENDVVRLEQDGKPFWVAGLGDQLALLGRDGRGRRRSGVDDLPGTLAKVTDNAPVILMAHEPDIFPKVPDRVALTLSGHTHGGQVRLFGYAPVVPSRFGNRYAYGHIVEQNRHLVVSGGLGCSILPVRFGSPPELVAIELGA